MGHLCVFFGFSGVLCDLLRISIVCNACGNAGGVLVRSESVVGDGSYVNNKFRRYYTICMYSYELEEEEEEHDTHGQAYSGHPGATSLLRQEPRDHCPPFSRTTPHVIQKKNIPASVSRRDAFDERVLLFANLPRGLVGSKNSLFPKLWQDENTRIRLSAIDLLGNPLSPRPQLAYPCPIAHAPLPRHTSSTTKTLRGLELGS
jgi:hypothetical protein